MSASDKEIDAQAQVVHAEIEKLFKMQGPESRKGAFMTEWAIVAAFNRFDAETGLSYTECPLLSGPNEMPLHHIEGLLIQGQKRIDEAEAVEDDDE